MLELCSERRPEVETGGYRRHRLSPKPHGGPTPGRSTADGIHVHGHFTPEVNYPVLEKALTTGDGSITEHLAPHDLLLLQGTQWDGATQHPNRMHLPAADNLSEAVSSATER